MKPLLIVLLCFSLTANAVLIVRDSRARADNVSTISLPNATPPAEGGPAGSNPTIDPDIITLLAANDPAAFARLRAAGFSEKAIRILVEAQVNELFQEKYAALNKRQASIEFWKRNYHGFNPAIDSARMDLGREKLAAMRKLLGPDYVPDMGRAAERYGNLSAAKVLRIQEIEEDYNAMRMAVPGAFGPSIIQFPEDREKLAYLEKEKRSELSQLLTPDELFEMDLRTSRSAATLRRQLAAFEPTEQEFRDLFKLRQAADEQMGVNAFDFSNDANVPRQKAQTAFDQQAKTLLGDDRYAEYQRANDMDYRNFYQIASRLDLPSDSAAAAQALKTSILQRQSQIYRDLALRDPTVRAQAVVALTQEAESGLRRILGDEGYQAYRTAPGNLFQRLRPPAVPPKR